MVDSDDMLPSLNNTMEDEDAANFELTLSSMEEED